jgi:hypothetical protein
MSYLDLLLKAKELIEEAVENHIYDEQNGEHPNENCGYTKWLKDCEKFLET